MRPFFWPMRWKILALILVVGLVPMGITALVEFRESDRLMRSSAQALLEAGAETLAGDLDELHASLQRSVLALSRQPVIERFSAEPGGRAAHAADAQTVLQSFLGSDPRLRSVSILGADGTAIAATDAAMVGKNFSFRQYFRQALRGAPGAPELFVNVQAGSIPLIAYSAPISANGRVAAVAVIQAKAAAAWDLIRAPHAGEGSFAVVLDQRGIRIAHSAHQDLLFHPARRLPPGEVDELAVSREFGEQTRTILE
ncbi:MAG TPA: cache domain-containing protein, partial [Myxococcales bacterium]